MIRRIQALNYRCLRYVDVRLDGFHILVGPNASGKSTLLDVVGFLSDLVRDGLVEAVERRTHNFQDLVWNRPRGDMGFELAVEFDIPTHIADALPARMDSHWLRYEVRIREDEESFGIDCERAMIIPKPSRQSRRRSGSGFPELLPSPKTILGRRGKGVFPAFFRSRDKMKFNVEGIKESSASKELPRKIQLNPNVTALGYLPGLMGLGHLSGPREGLWAFVYVEEIFNRVKPIFLDSLKIRQPSPPHLRRKKFSTDGSNLPWLVMELQQEHRADYADWLSHVQTMLPDLQAIRVVEREEDRSAYLMLRYKTGVEVPSWMVSDGTLRFLAITIIPYLSYTEQIYLLEEPENGIHPLAIDAVFQSLSSVYESQVLVATHSPTLLACTEPRQLLCFSKAEGETRIIPGHEHRYLKHWRSAADVDLLFASEVLG